HGGLTGAYARILLDGLVGPIGVSILVALGTLAGVVLVTGASLGVAMRASGKHMARAAGAGVRFSEGVGRRYRDRPAGRPILRAVPSPGPTSPTTIRSTSRRRCWHRRCPRRTARRTGCRRPRSSSAALPAAAPGRITRR